MVFCTADPTECAHNFKCITGIPHVVEQDPNLAKQGEGPGSCASIAGGSIIIV